MNPVVVRQLYHSLLKAIAPFCRNPQSDRMMCDRYAEYLPQSTGCIQPNDVSRTLLRKSFDFKHPIPKGYISALNKGFALLRDVNENALELEVSRRWMEITHALEMGHDRTGCMPNRTATESLVEGLALISATHSLSTRAAPMKDIAEVQKLIDEAKALFNARVDSVHQSLETSGMFANKELVSVDDAAQALSSIGTFLIDDCAFQLSHNTAEDFCIGVALQTKRVAPLILYAVVSAALDRYYGWQADIISTDSPPEMLRVYPKRTKKTGDVQSSAEINVDASNLSQKSKSKLKSDPLFFSLLHGVHTNGPKASKTSTDIKSNPPAAEGGATLEGAQATPSLPFILNLEEVVDILHKRRSSFSRSSLQRTATSNSSTELCVLRQALKLMLYQLRVSPQVISDNDEEDEDDDEEDEQHGPASRFDGRRRAAAMCRKQLLMLLTVQ